MDERIPLAVGGTAGGLYTGLHSLDVLTRTIADANACAPGPYQPFSVDSLSTFDEASLAMLFLTTMVGSAAFGGGVGFGIGQFIRNRRGANRKKRIA